MKDSVIQRKEDKGSVRFTQQLTKSPVAKFLQACGGTTQASSESARTLPAGFGAGPDPISPAAGPLRSPSLSSALLHLLPPSFPAWYGASVRPSLDPASPWRPDLYLTPCPSSVVSLLFPPSRSGAGLGCQGHGAGGWRAALTCHLVSLYSLVRPPVALTWAPQDALPVKQWPPGRRVPPSGRGKDPSDPLGCGLREMRPKNSLVLRRRFRDFKFTGAK